MPDARRPETEPDDEGADDRSPRKGAVSRIEEINDSPTLRFSFVRRFSRQVVMGFSHEHRFKKQRDITYNWKMSINDVAEYTNVPLETLQSVYDEEYSRTQRRAVAMGAVFNYCNGGSEWKRRHSTPKKTRAKINDDD